MNETHQQYNTLLGKIRFHRKSLQLNYIIYKIEKFKLKYYRKFSVLFRARVFSEIAVLFQGFLYVL